jgi:hypothetical protein
MHRRIDYPGAMAAGPHRVVVAGLDRLTVAAEPVGDAER